MKNLFNQNVNKFLNLKIQLFKEYHQHLSQDFGLGYPCRIRIRENRFLLSNLNYNKANLTEVRKTCTTTP